ncbi:MAG: hypothetical protein WBV62_16450 [Roseobacter sp.]
MTRGFLMFSAVIALAALAACGVDGEPVRPTASAYVGVGSGGVHSNIGVGVSQGPVSVFLGL